MVFKEKGFKIYLYFMQTILAFAAVWWIDDYFVLKVGGIVCIFYCLISSALIYFMENSKNRVVKYVAFLSVLPLTAFIFLLFRTNPYRWLKYIINWCMRYDRTENLYERMPANTILAAFSFLASILIYILIKKMVLRIILAAAILTVFVVFSIFGINPDKVVVGISIFYILCSAIEASGWLYSKKSGKPDKKESILYLLPICIILTLISAGLPSKPEPIQWTGIKRIYYSIKDKIDKLTTDWEFFTGNREGIFSISLSGYSDDGSLSNEDLKSDEKVVLTAEGKKGYSSLYLIGSVSDTYTGYSWEKSNEAYLPEEEEYWLDYAELFYGLSRLDPQVAEDSRLLKNASVTICYRYIKTRTFFYPSKSYRFNFINSLKEFDMLDMEKASITFPKAMGDNVAYIASYCEMNLQNEQFQEMLRASDSFSYKNGNDISDEKLEIWAEKLNIKKLDTLISDKDILYELLSKRADKIQKIYTRLPEELPERVKKLAEEITRDQDNNYDKLKAIEDFLLQYTYSYSPGEVPQGEKFTDFFLFENRKGYCTAFATSMAVLARCIGIPTRYVEGFLVDYSDQADGKYLVRNRNAHAWVEAYFEGAGWIPFEPTPKYNGFRYTAWPSEKEDNWSRNTDIWLKPEYDLEETIKSVDTAIKDSDRNEDILFWILSASAVIIIFMGSIACCYLILRHKYWKEFRDSDYSMKMYMIFIRILMLLKLEGFTLGKYETLLMLCDKVKGKYKFENIEFSDVADIYMSYRYGGIPVSEEKFDIVASYYKGLSDLTRSKDRKWKQLFEEFIFLLRRNSLNIFN